MSDNDSDTDVDAEELLQQSKEQTRHTSEPAATTASSAGVDRIEAIKEALIAIDGGEVPENINIRDKRLKALIVGLERSGDLEGVVTDVGATLDTNVDIDEPTQSDLARLLIRAGLQEALPDVLEDATEARQKALLEEATDF